MNTPVTEMLDLSRRLRTAALLVCLASLPLDSIGADPRLELVVASAGMGLAMAAGMALWTAERMEPPAP